MNFSRSSENLSKLSIIVPTLNEEGNIAKLVERVNRSLVLAGIDYEIIFIEDHSTDNTKKVIEDLSQQYPIRVYMKKGLRGKAYSLLEGFEYAQYDLVSILDADLQYPPEALPEMVQKIQDGADIIVANRISKRTTLVRKFISKIFSLVFTRLLHGLKCDVQSGQKVFRKKILSEVKLNPTPWTFDLDFLLQATDKGYIIDTTEIIFDDRSFGQSKIKLLSSMYEIGSNAVALKFKKMIPLHVEPYSNESMVGAGVVHNKKRFITHTTLNHEVSAISTFALWQKTLFFSVLAIILIGLFINALATGIVVMAFLSFIYFVDTVFNFYLVKKSLHKTPELKYTDEDLKVLNDNELPMYTILCPLYKEGKVLPHFLQAIAKLDWPAEKLDVLLLLEEDDKETISTAETLDLPSYVRVAVVPHSFPKTKPKACNYGLGFAKGEYLVIYDAEDIPDPLQLKKAYLAFKNSSPKVICFQAKLNYHNPHQNLLTRLFTAEYSLWFDVTLPGLQSINAYIPLGGTSNHFKTQTLRELQGWDPFNVTEDCDLGIRLFRENYQTAIIDSVTLEEANSNLKNWIRQRSRWVKGYMQTYLVHMRKPVEFIKKNGVHAFVFQLVVGGKIAFALINPILWVTTIAYFALRSTIGPTIEALFPPVVFIMAAVSLVFGNFLFLYYYMIGCAKRGHWSLMKYVYFVPFYWLATSWASYVAFYQLIVKPHYWEKTNHGLHLKEKLSFKQFASTLFIPKFLTPQAKLEEAEPTFKLENSSWTHLIEVESKVKQTVVRALAPVSRHLSNSLVSSSGILVATMMIANFLNLVFNAYLGRKLTFEQFGLLTLINTLSFIAAVFLNALSATVNHKVAYLAAKENISTTVHFLNQTLKKSLVLAVLISIGWLVVTPQAAEFFNIPSVYSLLMFTPVLVFGVILASARGFFKGALFFNAVSVLILVESIAKLIFGFSFVGLGQGQLAYLAIPLSIVISAVISIIIVSNKKIVASATKNSGIFPKKFYLASIFSGISSIVFLSLDIILVKHYLDPTSAGQYALLALVGKMVYFLGAMPNVFMLTFVSRAEGLNTSTKKTFQIIFASTVALLSIGLVFLGPFGRYIVPFLLGEKALVILPHLNIYLLAIALFSLSNVIVTYHLAKKRYIFPIVSLVMSLFMALGITLFHENILEIIYVISATSIASFIILGLLHLNSYQLRFIQRMTLDFVDVFADQAVSESKNWNQKKILIFNWRDIKHRYAGGAEEYVYQTAKRWVGQGHQVTLFCGSDGLSKRNDVVDGIKVIRRGGFYLVYLWAFVYYIFRFRNKYDVVIDCQNGIPFFTPLYVRKPVYCLMHHVHQDVFTKSLPAILAAFARFLEKGLMPLVYTHIPFITISNSSKKGISELGLGKAGIEIVHPGVDLPMLKPGAKSSEPTVLYLGRLKPYKSVDVLIKAFAQVARRFPQAKLVIAGSGEDEGNLKRLTLGLGLNDKVIFTGKVTNEQKTLLLQQAWVFVNPSFVEGWGITTIEANACATPVIASDVSGLRDSVINERTGYLVEYGNEDAFAQKIMQVISSSDLTQQLTRDSLDWAQKFNWDSTSESFLEIVKQGYKRPYFGYRVFNRVKKVMTFFF